MKEKTGVNPLKARQFNKQLILQYIRLNPNTSRAEIAQKIKLSAPSVTNIINALIDDNYVMETYRKSSLRGQPAVGLAINNKKYYTIGLHFDHSYHSGVLTNLAGDIMWEVQKITKDTSQTFKDMFRDLYNKVPKSGSLLGVGISSMGPISNNSNNIESPLNPSSTIFDLAKEFHTETHLPIQIENNATAAAIGEYWFGDGSKVRDYLYLNIGYGLGGGLIINNQVYQGRSQNAGEIGHFNVVEDGRLCFCGSHGCLESYLSLNALKQELGDAYEDPEYISKQFHNNEKALLQWLNYNLPLFAKVLVGATQLLDIKNIVIAGLLPPEIINWYIYNLPKYIDKYRIKTLPFQLNITQGVNSPNIPALGAATLPAYTNLLPQI